MTVGNDPKSRFGFTGFVVRRGLDTEAEARQLAAVHIEAWQWAYRGLMPDEYLARLDEQLERRVVVWQRLLKSDTARSAVWVAVDGPVIVGFAAAGQSEAPDASPTEAQLYSIYLLERVVGKGVGHALMAAATDDLRRQRYESCVLWVLESNQRARKFYEREGWAFDGGRQVDSRPGFDLAEVRYRRRL